MAVVARCRVALGSMGVARAGVLAVVRRRRFIALRRFRAIGIETCVVNQRGSDLLGFLVVATIGQAWAGALLFGLKDSEQNLTRNRIERGDYMGARNFLCKLFRTRRCGADDQFRVGRIHWQ